MLVRLEAKNYLTGVHCETNFFSARITKAQLASHQTVEGLLKLARAFELELEHV